MKKILSFFFVFSLVLIVFAQPIIAQGSPGDSSTQRVSLEIHQTKENSSQVHRAPLRIHVEAYYNIQSAILNICYDGEALGETYLYLGNNVIGYDSEINSSFQISTPGLYKIEIVGDSWIATGYIEI